MKISVIIPVYNAKKTLQRCVESVIYGQEKEIQVILVDDCSTDESWKICQKLETDNSQVCCFQNKKNSGVSYTRNQGLKHAVGEYILFVDSDDWVSGDYVSTMLHIAERQSDSLVMCGFQFIDQLSGTRKKYLFDHSKELKELAMDNALFDLRDKVYLQQLWNKVFRRDIIEKNHIRFDETQSMGEDFQFVLDYIEAARFQRCIVLNRTLYYYVRADHNSLMSKFGLVENEYEYRRMDQMLRLCGENKKEFQERYEIALANTRNNYIYQAVHSKKDKAEKLVFIESVMKDGNARRHYRIQKNILYKENICKFFSSVKAVPKRLDGCIHRKKREQRIFEMKRKLKVNHFTVISQNCIGGVFYHDMGLRFESPTINVFFKGSDFVKFVLKMDYYLSCELHMTWGEEYPIGYVGDVAIHFMHYNTCEEAKSAWNQRKKRIDRKKIIVICTDMEDFTDEVFDLWKQIIYPKVLFTADRKYANECNSVFFAEYEKDGRVHDLIPRREFYQHDVLLDMVNQFGGN